MDTKIRTFVKTFSYRIAVGISIFLTGWAVTGVATFGMKLMIISMTLGFACFYAHERLWNKTDWRRINKDEIESIVGDDFEVSDDIAKIPAE